MSKALLRFLALGGTLNAGKGFPPKGPTLIHVGLHSSLSYVTLGWGQKKETSLTVSRKHAAQAGVGDQGDPHTVYHGPLPRHSTPLTGHTSVPCCTWRSLLSNSGMPASLCVALW